MLVTIENAKVERGYSLDTGPVASFAVSICPAAMAAHDAISMDSKKGITPILRSNTLLVEHETLAKYFEDMATMIRNEYDD